MAWHLRQDLICFSFPQGGLKKLASRILIECSPTSSSSTFKKSTVSWSCVTQGLPCQGRRSLSLCKGRAESTIHKQAYYTDRPSPCACCIMEELCIYTYLLPFYNKKKYSIKNNQFFPLPSVLSMPKASDFDEGRRAIQLWLNKSFSVFFSSIIFVLLLLWVKHWQFLL